MFPPAFLFSFLSLEWKAGTELNPLLGEDQGFYSSTGQREKFFLRWRGSNPCPPELN